MYIEYYRFKEKPFGLAPNPTYLYLSESHREALNYLKFGIEQGEGFIVITGDVGTGKTTLCRTLLSQLKEGYKTAYIFNPILSVKDLLKNILEEFGETVKAGKTKRDLIVRLNELLLDLYKRGLRAVLIIDEAQDLSVEVLENIRLLSNLETTRDKLLQIVLLGQPELEEKLSLHDLRQLNQRITVRYCLDPLSPEETSEYIHHRLVIAGPSSSVRFERSAAKIIHRLSRGVPRVINQLCDRALLAGYVAQRRSISGKLVKKGLHTLNPRKSLSLKILRWAGITAGICLILAGGYMKLRSMKNKDFESTKYPISLTQSNPRTSLAFPSRASRNPNSSEHESTGGVSTHESH